MVKQQQRVDAVFAALADPTRRRIMERLSRGGESQVTSLARPFRMSLPAVSRHLRVLESAGLIKRQRHGREHLISANATGLSEVRKWMAQCAAAWNSGFDALDELLQEQMRKDRNS